MIAAEKQHFFIRKETRVRLKMKKEEVFENRKEIVKILSADIRKKGYMENAMYFIKRPYHDGEKKKKFSGANYLRLLSSRNEIIKKCDPRWYNEEEIKNRNWKLKENAETVELEVWGENQECELIKFYNAADIEEKEEYQIKWQSLEKVIKALQRTKILESSSEIISLKDGIEAVRKYSEKNGGDELTNILVAQMWLVESRIHTKIKSYLPIYPESLIEEIERRPEKIFVSMNKAQEILKRLKKEKSQQISNEVNGDKFFKDLKIIYHGREKELQDEKGINYPQESILTGESAYGFLMRLKESEENIKTWLEISYKDYNHGKILIKNAKKEFGEYSTVADSLRERLDKYRQKIINEEEFDEKILEQVKMESEKCQNRMKEFNTEEMKYIEENSQIV